MFRLSLTAALVLASFLMLASDSLLAAEASGRILPGAVSGTVRFAGTDTSFGLGGRLESHAVYSDVTFAASQWGRDRLRFSQIPVEGGNKDNQFRSNSRESRAWFRLLRPVNNQDLNVYIETDLNEQPDSYRLNVRHAYISIGSLLAGRSYTTFIDSSVLPDVDSGTGPGEVVLKRGQLRWTHAFSSGMELALALEEPDSVINDPGINKTRTHDDDQLPNIVSRLSWRAEWGQVSIASLLRKLQWQQNGQRLSELAGGMGVSGRINIGAVDNIRFMASYGDGMGRYLTPSAYTDGSVDSNYAAINTHSAMGLQLAYQHFWNTQWRSTFSLGASRSNLADNISELLTERARSVQANLFWSPVPDLSIGFEYLHARQQLHNGQDGELNRFLFSTRYTLEL